MKCTHPVLYTDANGIYCHLCGARINSEQTIDKESTEEQKAPEAPKTAVKRTAKRKG